MAAFLVAMAAFVWPARAVGQAAAASSPTDPPIKANSVVFLALSQEDYQRYVAEKPLSEDGLIELLSDYDSYAGELISVLRARGIAASFRAGKDIAFELSDGSIAKETLGKEDIIGLALFAKGKRPILVRPPRGDEAETDTVRHFGDYDSMANVISEYFGIWLPPYKGQDIAWPLIREAFGAYTTSPALKNAERVIASLPSKFDYKNVDRKEWENTLNYLDMINGQPFRVLEKLIREGNEPAIRVAFKTQIITDGAATEDLLAIISEGIRSNTPAFLEELAALKEKDPSSVYFILKSDADMETYNLIDDPQARISFRKEIALRVQALRAVARSDLKEIRDYCLKRYDEMLRDGR